MQFLNDHASGNMNPNQAAHTEKKRAHLGSPFFGSHNSQRPIPIQKSWSQRGPFRVSEGACETCLGYCQGTRWYVDVLCPSSPHSRMLTPLSSHTSLRSGVRWPQWFTRPALRRSSSAGVGWGLASCDPFSGAMQKVLLLQALTLRLGAHGPRSGYDVFQTAPNMNDATPSLILILFCSSVFCEVHADFNAPDNLFLT